MGNLQVVSLPNTVEVLKAIAFFKSSGLVKYAEPDYIVHVSLEPNDFRYLNGDQWNLNNLGQYGGTPRADINGRNRWEIQTRGSKVIVPRVATGGGTPNRGPPP